MTNCLSVLKIFVTMRCHVVYITRFLDHIIGPGVEYDFSSCASVLCLQLLGQSGYHESSTCACVENAYKRALRFDLRCILAKHSENNLHFQPDNAQTTRKVIPYNLDSLETNPCFLTTQK